MLDPTDPFDPPKLTFKPDGTIDISPNFENDPYVVKQVEASRIYLHLDWPAFVDDRTKLYNQVARKIEQGEQFAKRWANGELGSREALKNVVTDLRELMKEDQPYSAAASAYISIFREVWWVRDILLKLPPLEGAA